MPGSNSVDCADRFCWPGCPEAGVCDKQCGVCRQFHDCKVGDRYYCQVCDFPPELQVDLDPRPGHVSVDLRFGPMAVNFNVQEDGLTGYEVYLVEDCYQSRISVVDKWGQH